MKSFREHLLIVEVKNRGEEMEDAIAAAAQGVKYKPIKRKDNQIPPDAGEKIVKKMKYGKFKGKPGKVTPSKDWMKALDEAGAKQSKGKKESKTDLIFGRKKLSLKTANNSSAFITNSNPEEARVIFHFACKGARISPKPEVKSLANSIKKMNKSKLDPNLLPAKWKDKNGVWHKTSEKEPTDAAVRKTVAAQNSEVGIAAHKLRDKLQTDIDKLFTGNEKFAIAYVREGMSGERKFGKDSPGCAEFCLVTDATGDNVQEHNLLKDTAYLRKIAGRTKMVVRLFAFQVEGKKERRFGWSHMWSASTKFINEQTEKLESESHLLTEGAIMDRLKSIYNKVVGYIERALDKMIEWIGDSWARFEQFMGFQFRVEFNNEIRFD